MNKIIKKFAIVGALLSAYTLGSVVPPVGTNYAEDKKVLKNDTYKQGFYDGYIQGCIDTQCFWKDFDTDSYRVEKGNSQNFWREAKRR